MNPVFENIKTRRSIRAYQEQSIPGEALQMILDAAVCAPSGKNSQTRQFTVLRTPKTIQALSDATAAALERKEYNFFKPACLIIVSDGTVNSNSGFDCACALENIFLMAHGLGIGSCWINQMKDVENNPQVREMLTALGVPPHHHVYGMAALGYASVAPRAMDKSPQVIHFAD